MDKNTIPVEIAENFHTNFVSFFKEHHIEIPLIQRDYVQGSNTQSKKRNEFIDSLFNALLDKSSTCELDFIYGTYNNGVFLPLDGQQRLTTLFLLHWFLIIKSRIKDTEATNELLQKASWNVKEFKYKTRRSSTAFCDKLKDYCPTQLSEKDSISDNIQSQSWFSESWNLDPTVKAMLDMINALNEKFKALLSPDPVAMLRRLLETNAITFDKLDIGRHKLNDSLYIKMNARGKQLTDFENWKAKFIKFLEDTYGKSIYNNAEENRKEHFGTIKGYFTHSMEHEWTDLFWTYAVNDFKERKTAYDHLSDKEKHNMPNVANPLIDNYFLNFYYYIYRMLFYASKPDDGTTPSTEEEDNTQKGSEVSRKELFSYIENIEFLYQALDLFVNIENNNIDKVAGFFNDLFYIGGQQTDGKVRLFSSERTNLFESCIIDKASVDEQVLLFCIIIYCQKYNCYTVTENLKIFVRVCRNLLETINQRQTKDMRIRSNVRFSQLSKYKVTLNDLCSDEDVREIKNLAAGMGDVNTMLSTLIYYPDTDIYGLEDSEYTHGSLYAFDLNTSHSDILKAFTAFKESKDIERVRLLVAFGYKGSKFGNCAHGTRLFFGCKDRWDVLFRYTSDAPELKKAFGCFIDEYRKQPDVKSILSERLNLLNNQDCFVYYFLKYDAFANNHLWWIMDTKNDAELVEANHFFAVKSEFDIITLPRFSSNPLLGYHTEPYAGTVAQYFRKTHCQIYGKMDYTGKDRSKARINFTDNNVELLCTEKGWKVNFTAIDKDADKHALPITKLKSLSSLCIHEKRNEHCIRLDQDTDRIESAIRFIELMYQ